jgi:hypothetical protein
MLIKRIDIYLLLILKVLILQTEYQKAYCSSESQGRSSHTQEPKQVYNSLKLTYSAKIRDIQTEYQQEYCGSISEGNDICREQLQMRPLIDWLSTERKATNYISEYIASYCNFLVKQKPRDLRCTLHESEYTTAFGNVCPANMESKRMKAGQSSQSHLLTEYAISYGQKIYSLRKATKIARPRLHLSNICVPTYKGAPENPLDTSVDTRLAAPTFYRSPYPIPSSRVVVGDDSTVVDDSRLEAPTFYRSAHLVPISKVVVGDITPSSNAIAAAVKSKANAMMQKSLKQTDSSIQGKHSLLARHRVPRAGLRSSERDTRSHRQGRVHLCNGVVPPGKACDPSEPLWRRLRHNARLEKRALQDQKALTNTVASSLQNSTRRGDNAKLSKKLLGACSISSPWTGFATGASTSTLIRRHDANTALKA